MTSLLLAKFRMQISTCSCCCKHHHAGGLLYISFLLGRIRQPLSMLGSVTRETIQATKYFFFWSGCGWMITFPKNLTTTTDNATISPLFCGTCYKTANNFPLLNQAIKGIYSYKRFPPHISLMTTPSACSIGSVSPTVFDSPDEQE